MERADSPSVKRNILFLFAGAEIFTNSRRGKDSKGVSALNDWFIRVLRGYFTASHLNIEMNYFIAISMLL